MSTQIENAQSRSTLATGSAAFPQAPEVNPDFIGHSYVIARLRDDLSYHMTNERTDPECSWARIFELRSAIKALSSMNDRDESRLPAKPL